VAGQNLMLKSGQQVFKEGDKSDGMYLVRKGELTVYIERDGNVIQLAKVGAGGMIGEMAFFENKARSASVRAEGDSEVSRISNDEFTQLMKQIPKWFVGIMTSLSGRLRDTNARVQKLEAESKGVKSRYETMLKILHVLNLLWHKHGVKEGKDFLVPKDEVDQGLSVIFKLDPKDIKKFYDVMHAEKVMAAKTDSIKRSCLALANRGALDVIIQFIEGFLTQVEGVTCYPQPAVDMLKTISGLVAKMPYDAGSFTLEEVVAEGKGLSLDTKAWEVQLPLFAKSKGAFQLTASSDKKLAFRIQKKEFPRFLENCSLLLALHRAGIDR